MAILLVAILFVAIGGYSIGGYWWLFYWWLLVVILLMVIVGYCHNPNLAKCGGEAQHLEKVRIWSPPRLSNVRSSTARPKTPCIEVFFVTLKRS